MLGVSVGGPAWGPKKQLQKRSARPCLVGLRLLGWALLALAPACEVSGSNIDATEPVFGECNGDRDCPEDAQCLNQVCVDPRPPVVPLVYEIVPPAGTASIAGVAFTQLADYSSDEPPSSRLSLGFVSHIESDFKLEEVRSASCVPRSVDPPEDEPTVGPQVRVTMVPRKRILGFADAARVVDSAQGESTLAWNLAPGSYDMYVEPIAYDGPCARPPLLILDQTIPPGDVKLPISFGEPTVLDVRVRFPGTIDKLTGFSLTLVEASSGRPISSRSVLSTPVESDGALEYFVPLALGPSSPEVQGSSLLRLSPPSETIAPTVYVPLAVAELLEADGAVINQLTHISETVRFSGRVVRRGTLTGASAVLSFRAESLDSLAPGTLATLTRQIETNEQGEFEVDLPPGTYETQVEVEDLELARATVRFVVASSAGVQVGKTIEVAPRRAVSGRIWSPRGQAVPGAVVELVPEPAPVMNGQQYASWFERGQSQATALTSTSGSDGRFSLLSDAGVFSVIARPMVAGLPWLLRRSVLVGDGEVILGDLRAPAPVRVRGTVTSDDLGRVVPFALVRAYAFVKGGLFVSSVDEAEFVLPIGEGRAEENGRFDIFLPADVASLER